MIEYFSRFIVYVRNNCRPIVFFMMGLLSVTLATAVNYSLWKSNIEVIRSIERGSYNVLFNKTIESITVNTIITEVLKEFENENLDIDVITVNFTIFNETEGKSIDVISYVFNNGSGVRGLDGDGLSIQQLETNEEIILLNRLKSTSNDNQDIPRTMSQADLEYYYLGSEKYKVVGTAINESVIPFKTAIKHEYKSTKLGIYLNKQITEHNQLLIKRILNNNLSENDYKVVQAKDLVSIGEEKNRVNLLISQLVVSMCIFVLYSIILYIILLRKKELSIYYILGYTKKRVIFEVVISNIILSIIPYIGAILIYIFLKLLASKFSIILYFNTWISLAGLVLILILVSLFSSTITSFHILSKSRRRIIL